VSSFPAFALLNRHLQLVLRIVVGSTRGKGESRDNIVSMNLLSEKKVLVRVSLIPMLYL